MNFLFCLPLKLFVYTLRTPGCGILRCIKRSSDDSKSASMLEIVSLAASEMYRRPSKKAIPTGLANMAS